MGESNQNLSEEELKELADLEAEELRLKEAEEEDRQNALKKAQDEKERAKEEARRNKKGLKFDRNVFYNGKEYQVGNVWEGEVPKEIKDYLK